MNNVVVVAVYNLFEGSVLTSDSIVQTGALYGSVLHCIVLHCRVPISACGLGPSSPHGHKVKNSLFTRSFWPPAQCDLLHGWRRSTRLQRNNG